jgi:hypothetical protein
VEFSDCCCLFLAATLLACGSTPASSTNSNRRDAAFVDPRAALCANADGGEAGAPSFDLIQQVFTPNCVSCHTTTSDLDLSAGRAWANLVLHAAPPTEACGGTLVIPGKPDGSYLYQKLSQDKPCFGLQMPRGDFGSDPLPECLVTLVRDWIAAGALDSPSDAGGQ